MLEGGTDGLEEFVEDQRRPKGKRGSPDSDLDGENEEKDVESESLEPLKIRKDPRTYQHRFFELAKAQNTIINLGTGKGKTLIALLCIRHFSPSFEEGKQTWFLVPSIALAVQQSAVIKANLPYKVGIASHTAPNSELARADLASCNIMVATHGCALDLLRHYGDAFSLDRVNLLVLDECHYATKKHSYAVIMEQFYHQIPSKRNAPRVLGLTASPLINVKPGVDQSGLDSMLAELETMLDSGLVSLSSLDLPDHESGVIHNSVEERTIEYCSKPPLHVQELPTGKNTGMHPTREKELKRLDHLYHDLGPIVVGVYCISLVREISRNRFDKETPEQHRIFLKHLATIKDFCLKRCRSDGGRTGKLIALESVLLELVGKGDLNQFVGIIFAERRVTVLALFAYLQKLGKMHTASKTQSSRSDLQHIKCDMLTRQSTQVFKYLHPNHKLSASELKDVTHDWLHVMKNVRDVLDRLRRKETNVLISTSLVEEGVDVDACSFVIVLDSLKTTKSYIQMKGRARQKNAKLFVFQDTNPEANSPPVTLDDAHKAENRVNSYLGERKQISTHRLPKKLSLTDKFDDLEQKALCEGEYKTSHGIIDLTCAKSLVNRYAMSVPLDPVARTSRISINLHMPVFQDNHLMLPAHLPNKIRSVTLPEKYHCHGKKMKQSMLSLIACVRLHDMNVLNDRLLPLKREDMHKRLLEVTLKKFHLIGQTKAPLKIPMPHEMKSVYLYPLMQSGDIFTQHDSVLRGLGRTLAILSLFPLPEFPAFLLNHNELSQVQVQIGPTRVFQMSGAEWEECAQFYCTLINCRWRKRTGRTRFIYRGDENSPMVPPYIIASLKSDGRLDWERMHRVLNDYSRNETERQVTMSLFHKEKHVPRLIAPLYDPNVTYICYGLSGLTCSAPFPHQDAEYSNYREYMAQKRSFKVPADGKLLAVQRLWHLPRRMREVKEKKRKLSHAFDNGKTLQDGERAPCKGLGAGLLPRDACTETPLPDAALYLHCVLLPHVMYHVDQVLIAKAFIDHCKGHLGVLGSLIDTIPLENVLEALTAKSCSMPLSYDRLEYLGDAVLKLIQTDALLKSSDPDMRKWMNCLHEGDLSALRSAMGSNKRLNDAAKSLGFDKFILTRPLGRGQWVPIGLEVYIQQDHENIVPSPLESEVFTPSEKCCADVIEAILGLVYIHFGYQSSTEVAEELGVSIAQEQKQDQAHFESVPRKDMVKSVTAFLGTDAFQNLHLLEEATTHPSCIHAPNPSYQKLEWIGDAVLCLAAREKLYMDYPHLEVADLVLMETTLVCNETLAVLAHREGIHTFINHCDSSLPGRLEDFKIYLDKPDRGLWGLNPPKVLADVVEALLGAVHVEKGFHKEQQSALFVTAPFASAINTEFEPHTKSLSQAKTQDIMHPKQVMKQICQSLHVRGWGQEKFSASHTETPVWSN